MNHNIVQGILLTLSGTAIVLLASKTKKWQFIGCVIGVFAQPFWLWTTWINGQWGIFILVIVYLSSFVKGAIVRTSWGEHGRLRR